MKWLIKRILFLLCPRKLYSRIAFYYRTGYRLNLKNPVTFNEKLYWLKYYNGKYLKNICQLCYDKYRVREYIKNKVGEEYLNEIYGVYDTPEDINFASLPVQFVLKVTQRSGYNIICFDKATLDTEKTKKKLSKWQKIVSRKIWDEEAYLFDGEPKIICERLLCRDDKKIPEDIRVFCFNGKPKFIGVDFDTCDMNGEHKDFYLRNTYDLNWNLIPINFGRPFDCEMRYPRPENLDEILKIAETLAQDFIFVRVDLYKLEKKVLFGELTWVPMGGTGKIEPFRYNIELGDMLNLPDVRI